MREQQVRTCERQQHRGCIANARSEQLEEFERPRICPVDILEEKHRGLISRNRFNELPRGKEEHLPVGNLILVSESDEERQVGGEPVGAVADVEWLHGGAELLAGGRYVVTREDS